MESKRVAKQKALRVVKLGPELTKSTVEDGKSIRGRGRDAWLAECGALSAMKVALCVADVKPPSAK